MAPPFKDKFRFPPWYTDFNMFFLEINSLALVFLFFKTVFESLTSKGDLRCFEIFEII